MAVYCAFWGLLGALVYASTRLVAQVYAIEALDRRKLMRSWAQFVVAILTGPVAAAGFAPAIVSWLGKGTKLEAVALTLGLSANTLWPILVDGLSRRGRIWAGDVEP